MGRRKKDDYWDTEFAEDTEGGDNGQNDGENEGEKVEKAAPKKADAAPEKGKQNEKSKKKGGKNNDAVEDGENGEEGRAAAPKKQQENKAQPEKKSQQPAKKAAKEAVKESEPTTPSSDAVETTEDGAAATDDKTSKKKKGAKENPKDKAKEETKKRKGGPSKQTIELIAKMKEEEAKRKKEEEERLKKEAEEEALRAEEEARLEEIERIEREKRKLEKKERKKKQEEEEKLKKMAKIREQLLQGASVVAQAGEAEPKKKKLKDEFRKKKKVVKKADSDEELPPQKPQETAPVESKKTEPEPVDDWESKADDDWEAQADAPAKDSWEDSDGEKKEAEEKKKKQEEEKKKKQEEEKKKQEEEKKSAEKKEESKAPVKKAAQPKKEAKKADKGKAKEDEKEEDEGELRSPICCILGHVDAGKTKLLDYLRHSNVQEGEAGGITQQIGATYFPMDAVREKVSVMSQAQQLNIKVPGLLIIDTPGHESFNNLRSRGSSLCDIAVLVVNIMNGLQPQTIESLNLLRARKTPFIVALNQVDRLYGWKTCTGMGIQDALAKQDRSVALEYEKRVQNTVVHFAEQGLNATLWYKNKDFRKWVSIVPTSAISGEGVPDLLLLLVQLTQRLMSERLLYLEKLQCTVLEVKVEPGHGTTVDAVLVNGVLNEGDEIVLCGLNGPIVTKIRALLTPKPMKEMRVKGEFVHHKTIKAAQGIKIAAQELDKAVAGSSLVVVQPGDDIEELKEEVMKDLDEMLQRVDTSGKGVYVQASTLGSLEALLDFLKQQKVPVSGINVGPVNKKDVVKASVMLERNPEYALILAFDVKVSKEAREIADEMGVKIFTADIIYHLFDQLTNYMNKLKEDSKAETAEEAVFPCKLKIYPEYIFNKRDPIVLGVLVVDGTLKIGCPICVPSKDFVYLGRITSIENNHKPVEIAKKGQSIAIKIEIEPSEQLRAFGRHFDETDELVSRISRRTIDVLKQNYKDEISKEDVQLLARLKVLFGIQ